LEQFFALPDYEQQLWTAWETQRQEAVNQAIEDAIRASERTNDQGESAPRAEIASTILLTVLARLNG